MHSAFICIILILNICLYKMDLVKLQSKSKSPVWLSQTRQGVDFFPQSQQVQEQEQNQKEQDLVFSVELHLGLIPYPSTLDTYPYPLFLIP